MSQMLRAVALLAMVVALAACEFGPSAPIGDATPTVGDKAAPIEQAAAPTAPVEVAPAPAPAPAAAGGQLVGQEWTILYAGDLNGDKRADVVGIKLAQGLKPDATFQQPGYSAYKGPATELVIVQAGDDGKPQIQAALAGGALNSAGGTIASFSGAAAYMVSVTPGARPLVTIWGISAAGAPVGKAVGLEWNGGYALFGGLAK